MKVVILGIRGLPARHGGFETFTERLALHLVEKNWSVYVYCQEEGREPIYYSTWKGVNRIHVPVRGRGSLSTVIFDLKSILHSLRHEGVFLTLGYNTSIFNVLHRIVGKKNIFNMDGIEWKRRKWSFIARSWLWLNERLACWFGSHLIADHPEIVNHLSTKVSPRKMTMIPYGGEKISAADPKLLDKYGLKPNDYAIVIARAEPENSIAEIVSGFSNKIRGAKLVVLGDYDYEGNKYHRDVQELASDEVVFLGSIYDSDELMALRFFARFYVHGHQVGGTNPSLVEALGAGSAILARDNLFNRWVAKEGAIYFDSSEEICTTFTNLFEDDELLARLRERSREQFDQYFKWAPILESYEALLLEWLPRERA